MSNPLMTPEAQVEYLEGLVEKARTGQVGELSLRVVRNIQKTLEVQEMTLRTHNEKANRKLKTHEAILDSISRCAAAAQDLLGDIDDDDAGIATELAKDILMVDSWLRTHGYETLILEE